MRGFNRVLSFVLLGAVVAMAASKEIGQATLKDLQPVATTTKQDKHQLYDFSFEALGKKYVCRTSPKTSVKATDFVVGSTVQYEIKSNSGKLKSSDGKEVKCTIIRVEKASASQ